MDDEPISDRFWFDHSSGRRLYPQRQTNRQTGKALFRVGKGRKYNRVENQLELENIEEVYRYVFHEGWSVRMRAEDGRNGMYNKDGPSIIRTSESGSVSLTSAVYRSVLSCLSVGAKAREFLAAHYYAPNRTASMGDLATAVGYDTHGQANFHYGKLAHRVADELPAAPLDLSEAGYGNWMQALAYSHGERNEEGHFLWTLRPEVAAALEELGWVSPDVRPSPAPDPEPPNGGTTRQAVIDARRGQGPFRHRVLQYWGGRCAVTGCAVTKVLVASHIKAWTASSDIERLDGFNGLLLTPNLDKLFDSHLIGFDEAGRLLVSKSVASGDARALGLFPGMRISRLHGRHALYLKAHRERCQEIDGVPLGPLRAAGKI